MPEEKPLIIDPILTQLSRLDEKLDAYRSEIHAEVKELGRDQRSLMGDVAELKGGFAQMDKRVENLEKVVGQIQWSLVSGFLVTILAVILTKLL